MNKAATATSKNFDPVKLEALTEPLFVRIEKKKGHTHTPIPMPAGSDGSPQGANWSKEDIKGLESWLVNEWSGGGYYKITISDSNMPTPQKMDWEVYWPPNEYPEKVPPTLSAAAAAPPPQPQVRQMAQAPYPSAFPGGFPAGLGFPATQLQPQQQQWSYPFQLPPSGPYTPLIGGSTPYNPQVQAAEMERQRFENERRALEAQLQRSREEQIQARHQQELERAEAARRAEMQAQNERFSKLEQLIASLATAQTAKPGIDPQLEAMKEQNRALEARLEADRREREAERRERELQDQIRRQTEETQRQIDTLSTLIQTNTNKSMDPMIMMLQENARQQAEAMKELARQQTMQLEKLGGFMMNPRDIMTMAKESSSGIDQATREITNTYKDILQMQRQAVEQIMQLNNTGGSETIALVKEGIERAASLAERYVGGKVKEATVAQQAGAAHAQAQAAQSQAQAVAMQAQVRAQELAFAQSQRAAGAAPVAVPAPAAGVNGARPAAAAAAIPVVAAVAGPAGETQVAQTSSAPLAVNGNGAQNNAGAEWTTGPVPPVTTAGVQVRRHKGRTDAEWFGPIAHRVEELRKGVARFHDSLKETPPRVLPTGKVDGVEPDQTAEAVLQAAMMIAAQRLSIPAMSDLLAQGMVADFLDVLLPDASQNYRDDVAQAIHKKTSGEDEDEDPDDDSDDGDDDGDDGAHDGAPAPGVSPQPVTLVPPSARA